MAQVKAPFQIIQNRKGRIMPNSKHSEPHIKSIANEFTHNTHRGEIYSQWESISPGRASEYLKKNHCNRPLKKASIKRYARDMAAGAWRSTHQSIAFDRKGHLLDGQHRLHAIIMANVTIKLYVTRNVSAEVNDGIDNGLNRTTIDILHYHGIQADNLVVGLIRWMAYKVGDRESIGRMTRAERVDFYNEHSEAISFVVSLFAKSKPVPRTRISSVLAVFGRAYYSTKDKLKLERAAEIMITGVGGDDEERWLIMLRNYLLYQKSIGGEVIRQEIYLKTERALHAYLHGEEVVGNLRSAPKELFPLPGEEIKPTPEEIETAKPKLLKVRKPRKGKKNDDIMTAPEN